MTAGVTQTAFANRVGLSRRQVARLLADGVLPRNEDGTLPLQPALRSLAAHRRAIKAAPSPAAAALRERLSAALVREREAKAEQRELDLARQRGELVPLAEVVADATAGAGVARSILNAIAPRAAALAAAVDEGPQRIALIETVIATEVNAALAQLHQSRFVDIAGVREWVCGWCNAPSPPSPPAPAARRRTRAA